MIANTYRIERLGSVADAERIVAFFFSPYSFDDTRHTPGEEEHFRTLPYRALEGEAVFWFVTNEQGDIVAVNSVKENEQKTGGYSWDYIVVHRDYRSEGIASRLIEAMFLFLEYSSARYVMTYTCSLPEYGTIRKLFERNGFELIGRCPDYYFEGEDRLIYCRKIS
ncbi:GNAT family N-acetyltransferase [Cohnella faecalis]|uniref:N-acetyltransferase n=1 Tax=Cohnella faecalis TaxID=2315694 RepID=A0A398CMX3_9BACL|nr:GNAT family N-acetyltransferase [Cohnella faecalis]RIE02599.1 N-acetyltransferase [Cohnella faecalis]